jgi:hypothetical protein
MVRAIVIGVGKTKINIDLNREAHAQNNANRQFNIYNISKQRLCVLLVGSVWVKRGLTVASKAAPA